QVRVLPARPALPGGSSAGQSICTPVDITTSAHPFRMSTSAQAGRTRESSMSDPLARISTIATPQTRRIPGRTGQVRNAGGGYVFAKDLWTRLEDFLILGTTGGTYYVGEDELTADNAGVLFQAISEDGPRVVQLLTDISTARPPRAPKNRPALFA